MLMREVHSSKNADDITIEEFINAEEAEEKRVVQQELDACLDEDFDMEEFEKCMKEPLAQYRVALLKSLARANVTLTDIGELLQKIEHKLK